MAEAFDPYYIWLGIPPEEQPADHYRLLGVRRFENNEEVIVNAADQRVRHLRSMQTGKRQAETQKLLNEIAAASGVLLNPDKRKAYDAQLTPKVTPATPPPAPAPLRVATPLPAPPRPAPPAPVVSPISSGASQHLQAKSRSSKNTPLLVAILGACGVGILAMVLVVGWLVSRNLEGGPTVAKPKLPTGNPSPGPRPPDVNSPVINKNKSTIPPNAPGENTTSKVAPAPVQPTAVSSPAPPTVNPAHQSNWEYGYGQVDGSGRVLDFRPLVYSVMTNPDGTKSVLWGTELAYSDKSPMGWMCLRRDGGVPGYHSQTVVVRRWRCPENAYVAVKGEVQHASMQGDGIHAYLVTSTGRKVWSAAVMNTQVAISAGEFLLPPNETLDFYVDCQSNQAFDHFKSHLVLDVRYTRRGREPKTDRWDSIADYRDPSPPPAGQNGVTARFVRVELPGNAKVLNLAEVQAFSGNENVALKGNATQSSTDYEGAAKLANDGNTNGDYPASKSVSHTKLQDNPWWEVDLGAEKVLDKIVVWNRTDGGTEPRLQGYKLLALDASRNVIWQVSPPEYPKPSSEFAPLGINREIPAGAETARLGKPVDLLRDVRVVQGESAQIKDGRLETAALQRRLANMVFDYVPSGEYLLDATVTRTSGKDGLILGITVDGHPCSVDLECFVNEGRGVHNGLELINGQRLISPAFPPSALYKGNVLTNGKSARVQIFVRKGNVAVQVDGKILFDWKGNPAQLARIPVTLSAAGPRVAVGTWESTYTIESLRIYPILSEGTGVASAEGPAAVETSAKATEVTDKTGRTWSLKPLETTDLIFNVSRKHLTGSFRMKKRAFVSGGQGADRVEFSVPAPSAYVLDAQITRSEGEDAIVLGLFVGDRPVGLVIDGWSQQGWRTGLETLRGLRLNADNHPAAIKGKQLTNGKPATLRVFVKPDMLVAELDGRKIADWIPADGELDRHPDHQTPNNKNFALCMWSSSYAVEALTVTKVEAIEKSRAEKPMELAKVAVPDEAALAKARDELKATYGDVEQKGKKPEEKLKLAQELVSVAASEQGPALRYVLLDAARKLAVEGQDIRAAMAAAGMIEEGFQGDGLEIQLQTLKLAAAATLPTGTWESAAELAGELATSAAEKGRFEVADSASQLAVDYAARSKSADLKKTIKQLRDKVAAQLKEWEAVKAAEQTLAASPEDAAANLAVGKWNCLHLGDWEKGIPQLAKGGNGKLAAAAVAEKEDKLLPAADAWSAAADSLSGAEKLAAQRHALELYQEASEKLSGLEQLKAAKRVGELTEVLAQSAGESPSIGGMVPRSKPASDVLRSGLLIRIYASQPPKSPTPALGVIQSYDDFASQRERLARELNYPPKRLTFAGIGYIELERDESLTFRARNATIAVDGAKVISNNPFGTASANKTKNPNLVTKLLKKGRHSLQVVPFDGTSEGPEISITRPGGGSVISYSPVDLDTELSREISFRGSTTKGKFSLGVR